MSQARIVTGISRLLAQISELVWCFMGCIIAETLYNGEIVTNPQIEELYIISSYARNNGQEFIPVHIFPIRFNRFKSIAYLNNLSKNDEELKQFEAKLKQVFDYFEVTKQIPILGVNNKGQYVLY